MSSLCRVHELYNKPLSGAAIEARSFATIDRELPQHGLDPESWEVARRMVHTCGDLGLVDDLYVSPHAIDRGVEALRSCRPIYVDSNMARSGVSQARLRRVAPGYGPDKLLCHVADDDVAAQAKEAGLPRSLFAIRKAAPQLEGAIVALGNAPVALLELNRLMVEEKLRPALVLGLPVGFVHVDESKEELRSLNAPCIILAGRRGGSPLAVATLHALCTIAEKRAVS